MSAGMEMAAGIEAARSGVARLQDGADRVRRGRIAQAGRRLRRRPGALIGAAVILLFVAVALLAPVIAPADPNEISRDRRAGLPPTTSSAPTTLGGMSSAVLSTAPGFRYGWGWSRSGSR